MTTDGATWVAAGDRPVLTQVPERGTVLVRASTPPAVGEGVEVDVRPGPHATIDGDRIRLPLCVRAGGSAERFGRHELAAIEERVADHLATAGAGVLRFGDRATLGRHLPAGSVRAIERRLAAAARRGSAPLVIWTSERPATRHGYDVVLE